MACNQDIRAYKQPQQHAAAGTCLQAQVPCLVNTLNCGVPGVHSGRPQLANFGQHRGWVCQCGWHRGSRLPNGPPGKAPLAHSESCWHGHLSYQHFSGQISAV